MNGRRLIALLALALASLSGNPARAAEYSFADSNTFILSIGGAVPGAFAYASGVSNTFTLRIKTPPGGGADSNRFTINTLNNPVDGVFITVTIHGQLSEAILTNDANTLKAPAAWATGMQAKFGSLAGEINNLRGAQGKRPILHVPYGVDWAARTWPGLREIVAGRVLEISGQTGAAGLAMNAIAIATGGKLIEMGRMKSSQASRQVAGETGRALADIVGNMRQRYPGVPLNLDFIAHSRGGAVTSGVLDDLFSRVSAGGIHVSITYLDAIDPTPSGLPSLAGNLVGDPPVTAKGIGERASNFHAEHAWLQNEFSPGWFGNNYIAWLAAKIGVTLTDAWLYQNGYPRGRSRPEITPVVNELRAGSTHGSVADDFVNDILLNIQVGGNPGATNYSFLKTSYFGDLLRNPTKVLTKLSKEFDDGPPLLRAPAIPAELIRDGDFILAAQAIGGVTTLLGDATVRNILTGDVITAYEMMAETAAASFPAGGVWQRRGEGVTIQITSGTSCAKILGGSTLFQEIDPASLKSVRFTLSVKLRFLSLGGYLKLSLAGENLQQERTFLASQVGVGTDQTVGVTFERSAAVETGAVLDRIEFEGNDVLVLNASSRQIGDGSGVGQWMGYP